MHWKERRGDERESVLVRGPCDHMSDFCVDVKGCIATWLSMYHNSLIQIQSHLNECCFSLIFFYSFNGLHDLGGNCLLSY